MAQNPNQGAPENPHSMPITTPSFGGMDNWSLQALVEVKSVLQGLSAKVDGLNEKVRDLNTAHEKANEKLISIEKKIYAATLIVTLVVGIAAFVGNKAIDFGLEMAKGQQSLPVSTAPATAPTLTAPLVPGTAK